MGLRELVPEVAGAGAVSLRLLGDGVTRGREAARLVLWFNW